MDKYLPLIFLLICISCSNSKKNENSVLFSGEIVNPTSEYVVLYKGAKTLDSIKLDGNNRFSFELDSDRGWIVSF